MKNASVGKYKKNSLEIDEKDKVNDLLIGRLLFQIRYVKRRERKQKGINM